MDVPAVVVLLVYVAMLVRLPDCVLQTSVGSETLLEQPSAIVN